MMRDLSPSASRRRQMALPLLLLLLVPSATSATADSASSTDPKDAKVVRVNRQVPLSQPPPQFPIFSATPTDQQLIEARVFDEPLVPAGGSFNKAENKALAAAVSRYLRSGRPDDLREFQRFLDGRPTSRWKGALLVNLGIAYRRTGYFTRALAAWEQSWTLLKDEEDLKLRALADRAIGELAELNSRLGRLEQLRTILREIQGRDVRGSASEKVAGAHHGLAFMLNEPDKAFRCGPMALDRILAASRADYSRDVRVFDEKSTFDGTSLTQMRDLAHRVGSSMQMARRAEGADILVPAMVHWRAGHFAALVRQEGKRYLVQDPTFGDELWVTRRALDDEASGYMLVRDGALPRGWAAVSAQEGRSVWGKGFVGGAAPGVYGGGCPTVVSAGGKACSTSGCSKQMAEYTVNLLQVNLYVTDTPVWHTPPRGPEVSFTVAYNQREPFQPQIPMYSHLGPKWTHDWLSYVEDNPANPSQTATVYLRRGGFESHSSFNSSTGEYGRHYRSRVVLARTAPAVYERRLADGGWEVFAQPDGASTFPRRVFLTAIVDPQGNQLTITYDSSLRITAVTDALGQVTTFSYEHTSDTRKITKVTDPFGRFAQFAYDATGRLQRITDMGGLQSEFEYGPSDLMTALITPYGRTTFSAGQTTINQSGNTGYDRWLEVTDPLGAKERVEFRTIEPTIAQSDPPNMVPAGMLAVNSNLYYRNTFFWDKRAMAAMTIRDYSKAHIYHWLHDATDTNLASGTLQSEKAPLESRVWYEYPGQTVLFNTEGSDVRPKASGRVLDDGTAQLYKHEYGPRGNVCKEIDPRGRETRYTYGTGSTPDADCATGTGLDLLRVEQKNLAAQSGTGWDTVESITYNAQHRPVTVTDASGQVTTYTYNPNGTLTTVVSPPRGGLSQANRTTTYTYFADNAPTGPGRLETVTAPLGLTMGITYDGYTRVRTTTSSDSNTLTYDYDELDRPTKRTFADGTFEEKVYRRLDLEEYRDREGHRTHFFHDALRRLVSTRDPLGRVTTQKWCSCGSLDSVTDANGNTTTWERDLQGRVTKETRPNTAYFWLRTYENTTSRIKRITDPSGQHRDFEYFLDDRLKQVSYPNAVYATPIVSFAYDTAYPRATSMTDGTGTTNYSYNPVTVSPSVGAGELSSVDGPVAGASDAVTYAYDEVGRRVSRTIDNTTTTWIFDALGRVATVTHPLGTLTYGYAGTSRRRTSLSYPNGMSTTYAFRPSPEDRRLEEIHHKLPSGATLARFNYAWVAGGDIKTWQQQDESNPPRIYDLGFDPADQLTLATYRTTDPTPTVLKRYAYAYDSLGNRTTQQVDDAPLLSAYDNMNRLLSQQPGGALAFKGTTNEPAAVVVQGQAATTTSSNQFVGSAQAAGGTNTVTVVAQDYAQPPNVRTNTYQVTISGATRNYTYDANGNLTQKVAGDTWGYEWYADSRLARVTKNAAEVARFAYDGLGRRYQKIAGGITTTYAYDMEDVFREEISGGTVYRYVHGGDIDEPLARSDQSGAVVYYHADHLGSIVKTTSSSGTVAATRRYDPYGNLEAGASEAGYAFTGREWDPETSLYFYRERWYDPEAGRFLSEDPLGMLDGPNQYSYVQGNPITKRDPSGTTWQDFWECVKNPASCATATMPCYLQAEMLESVLTRGADSDDDRPNALKHCVWGCCIGAGPFTSWKKAIQITDAHEADDRHRPEEACGSEMDRWNNRVGIQIGRSLRYGDGGCLNRCDKSPMLRCEPRNVAPILCQSGGF